MAYADSRRGPIGWLGSLLLGIVLLIVEVFLTMLIYTLLNLYTLNGAFGTLVQFSDWVRELLVKTILYVLPGQANAAYATLIGEFSPKAVLLLLLGLVVAAIVRGLTGLAKGVRSGRERS
jgi:hypothetical protein